MFESEFAKCEYVEKDNVVFHVWKKEAHFDDYRNPVIASLEMLREHKGSLFIVDARNGFEDVKEDVDWGFSYFLPELKKTGCSTWGFILPKTSGIEGEIDLWTKEIEKNFRVIRAESYDEILRQAAGGTQVIIRDYGESDFEGIKNWITDERTHAMWCANRAQFPLQKQSFDEFLKDISMRNGDHPFVAVDENGVVMGFFCYSLNAETKEGMFKFVMVDPARRGIGLGKEMLKQAVRYAFDVTKADAVQLMVFSENARARKCYEGVGFTVRKTQERAFQFKGEAWDRINMVIKKMP